MFFRKKISNADKSHNLHFRRTISTEEMLLIKKEGIDDYLMEIYTQNITRKIRYTRTVTSQQTELWNETKELETG